MALIDLSHPVEDGMSTYPGLPGPSIGEHLTFEASHRLYAPGTEFSIGTISMVSNTGTYLDAPGHRYRGRADLAGLPLERCADLPVVVVDPAAPEVGPDDLPGGDLAGSAVLLRTGWDAYWRTERYGDPAHPFLGEAGARALVTRGVALVGIDSVNIDHTGDGRRPAHSILLDAGIPVLEHLTRLELVPATGARLTAAPPAVRGMSTFPVRAFVVVGPRSARTRPEL